MQFSFFENDETLGQTEGPVRLFTFYWNGVHARWSNQTLQGQHAIFNQAFVQMFPRLLYTNPFTSYTAGGFAIGSQLTGTGETRLSNDAVKAAILAGAEYLDIVGEPANLRVEGYTIEEIENGATLPASPSTVAPLATTDGANAAIHDVTAGIFDGLDASKYYLIAAALAVVLLLKRR